MNLAITVSPEWAQTIRLLLAVVIPLAVGLLTKSSASSGLKASLNVVLSALVTAVTTILDDASAHLSTVISQFIVTSVSSVATYYGVWKPTGVAGTIAAKTPGFGIGSPPPVETQEKGLEDLQVEPEVMDAVAEAVEQADEDLDAKPKPRKRTAKKADG